MNTVRPLMLAPAPHVHGGASVPRIMMHVLIALAPATAFAVYLFGLAALLTLTVAIVACVAAERLLAPGSDLRDGSAVVTGVIFALTLPPSLPLWMVATGGFLGMAVGKALFGGLGANPFNPALVGRVFLQAAFPVSMTTWAAPLAPDRFTALPATSMAWPFQRPAMDAVDAMTSATPLGAWKFDGVDTAWADLLFGFTAGSTGETSAVLLLAGGLYLVLVGAAQWRIPLAILLTVAVVAAATHAIAPATYPSAPFMLLSGGLMLGAWFMATDPVASPVTAVGAWVYGVVIGLLVVVIRLWAAQPEGVMYAILLGNAIAPHIDRWLQPRVYGTRAATR
jgi:Na+-translocating ferredoxin:NAD+ oxidoreductase subunit D